MAYVYRHIRLDKNEVFYIGIGADNKKGYMRATSRFYRNKMWWDIVNCTAFECEILIDDIDYAAAKEKEKEFILLYGRADLGTGVLVNMTDGGQGVANRARSTKGKLNPMYGRRGKDAPASRRVGELHPQYGKVGGARSKGVLQKSMGGDVINEYVSINQAAVLNGWHSSNICNCIKGKHRMKTYKGFLWEYKISSL